MFAPLPAADGNIEAVWGEFKNHLAKVTGKKARGLIDYPDLSRASPGTSGRRHIHICGVNTGGVPAAVNAGFVPVCVPGAADGSFGYEMEIIVRADSPIKSPKDLKGKSVKLVAASSLVGLQIPDCGAQGGFPSLRRAATIRSRRRAATTIRSRCCWTKSATRRPVANDMLNRAQAHGTIKAEQQYRSIYKSPKLPPGPYGYVYNLTPELAAKVRSAFFTCEWKGTGLEKSMGSVDQVKFVPIDYKKKIWEYVPQHRPEDSLLGAMISIRSDEVLACAPASSAG